MSKPITIEKGIPLPENLKRNLAREKDGRVTNPLFRPVRRNRVGDQLYSWARNTLKGAPLLPRHAFELAALRNYGPSVEYYARHNPFGVTRQPVDGTTIKARAGYDWTYPNRVYSYDLMGTDNEAMRVNDALVRRTVYCITELLHATPTAPQADSDEYSLGLDSPVYAHLGLNPWTVAECLLSAVHGQSLYTVLRSMALKPVRGYQDSPEYEHRFPKMSPRCAVEALLTVKVRDLHPLMCKVAATEGIPAPRDSRTIARILNRQLYHPGLEYEKGPERGVDLQGVPKAHRRAMVRHLLRGEPLAEARMNNEAYERLYKHWVDDFGNPKGRLQKAARTHLTTRAPGFEQSQTELRERQAGVDVLLRHLTRPAPFYDALRDFLQGVTNYYEVNSGLSSITAKSTGHDIDLLLRNMWLRLLVRFHFKTHGQLEANELVILSLMTGVPVTCFLNYLLWEEHTWEIGDLNTNVFPEVVDILENLRTFDPVSRDELVYQVQELDATLAVRVADRYIYGLTELVLRTAYPFENL